jgi:hypothetical protein
LCNSVKLAPPRKIIACCQTYNSCIQGNPIEKTYLKTTTKKQFRTHPRVSQDSHIPIELLILSIILIVLEIIFSKFNSVT